MRKMGYRWIICFIIAVSCCSFVHAADSFDSLDRSLSSGRLNSGFSKKISADEEERFKDVLTGNWNYDAIEFLAGNNTVFGYPDGQFKPNEYITRAEFIVLLCRALNRENDAEKLKNMSKFIDVPNTHWASGYINFASNVGIITGTENGVFEPESNVRFEQAIKMVVAALGYSQTDAESRGGYPTGYLSIGSEIGLGYKVFNRVGDFTNRGTVAQIIYNGSFSRNNVSSPYSYYESGEYENQFYTYLISEDGRNDIYYTVDGTLPTTKSQQFQDPIPITRSTVLKAIAVNKDGVESKIVSFEFKLKKWDAVYEKSRQIIASVIKPKMSDFEKEKALHDYLVLNSRFDIENYNAGTVPPESFHPYGVLINGVGVCQAYAQAMKMLLNMVDIECMVIIGEAKGTNGWESHAWNIVKIDDVYYHLDVLWDDPVPDGILWYRYFNISDDTIWKNHWWDTSDDYPSCGYDMDMRAFSNPDIENTYIEVSSSSQVCVNDIELWYE